MASRGSPSSCVAMCLVLLLLVVSLQPSSAVRPLRPPGVSAVDASSEVKDHAIVDKYGPLLLTMLPRGPVPPSGPSGGTNESGN